MGAAIVGVLFAVSGCAAGSVEDKRAPGIPGEKTFQVRVKGDRIVGPDEVWITVPEDVWDKCVVGQPYRRCAG